MSAAAPLPGSLPDAARAQTVAAFLRAAGWTGATRGPLAGDASARRYERLARPGPAPRRAVLMDADPARGEDVRPFCTVAAHLRDLGLSAPEIYAADPAAGLLLLEDFGDGLFSTIAADDPAREGALYAAAVDALAALHRHAAPAWAAPYGPDTMADRASLAALWYRPGATGAAPGPAEGARLAEAARAALAEAAPETPVLALRDVHAQNLVWLPERAGPARVGLLDFQDAMAGHPAYDLVSLLEDARRDVPAALRAAMLDRFAARTGADPARLAAAAAVLGAQRALRILGVFARLAMHHAKPGYVALIPRVWAHLQRDLSHPAAAGLRAAVAATLPPPDPSALARLRAAAGTCPDPAGPPPEPARPRAP